MIATVLRTTDDGFDDAWRRFVRVERVSPFFSQRWVAYQIAYSEDQLVKDLSFVGLDDSGTPVVLCPLFLEQRDGKHELSYRGEYLQALRAPIVGTALSAKQRERVRNAAFEEIDRLARETAATKITFLIDPLCEDSQCEGYDYLQRYGFLNSSLTTVLIGLDNSVEPLKRQVRKSYRSLINQASREFNIAVYDAESIGDRVFEAYVQLHARAAGRRTRPERTFQIQLEMIRADEGSLVGVQAGGRWMAFVYFLHSNYAAYYGSGAQDPDSNSNAVGPAMQWAAMTYYAERNLRWIELDNQYFGPQFFEIPSAKDIRISFFKRGFGGRLTPLHRGIKYYDRSTMQTELGDRLPELMDAYFGTTPE